HPRLPGRHALARRHARPIQKVGVPHGAEIGRPDRAGLGLGRPRRPRSAGDDRAPWPRARARRTSDSHRRPVRACARGAHGEGSARDPRASPLTRASFRRTSRSQVCEILSFREGARVSTTTLNEQSVLDALKQVKYPGFSRDIVSFGFIKDLALGLKKLGYEVGLMDSDIYGPSQQMMMGITTKPFVNEEEKILPIERF